MQDGFHEQLLQDLLVQAFGALDASSLALLREQLRWVEVAAGQTLMAQGEPFAACYWDTAEGRVFGLRATDDGVDVSDVAKQYGGGGHAKAAGFKVPRSHELAQA